jgi:maltose-binding protein MalE
MAAACGGDVLPTTTTAGTITTSPTGPTIVATTPTTAVITIPRPTAPLVVWVADPALGDAVMARGDAYTSETGVAVEVKVFTPAADGSGPADLLTALLDDALEGPADIYLGPHTWVLPLAEAGLAEPIPLSDGLAESIVASVSPRGHPLAAPLAVDGVVQVRNRALLPEPPETVESIPCPDADSCLLLPADGDADLHYPFLVADGGYLFGPDPEVGYDTDDIGLGTDEAIAGVGIFAGLLADGTIAPVADAAAAIAEFAAGGAALAWIRASGLAAVQAGGMDIAIEPLPGIGGNPGITSFRTLAAYVNPFGAAKSEAVAFAVDWLGGVSGSGGIALATGMAPVWPEATTDTSAVVLESVAAGHPVPTVADIDRIWFELGDAFRRIHTGATVADALFGAIEDIRP